LGSKRLPDAPTLQMISILTPAFNESANLPVLYDGRVLGTVNLLDREGAYGEHQLDGAMLLAQQLLPAFLR